MTDDTINQGAAVVSIPLGNIIVGEKVMSAGSLEMTGPVDGDLANPQNLVYNYPRGLKRVLNLPEK